MIASFIGIAFGLFLPHVPRYNEKLWFVCYSGNGTELSEKYSICTCYNITYIDHATKHEFLPYSGIALGYDYK